jgi:hypothetical protein
MNENRLNGRFDRLADRFLTINRLLFKLNGFLGRFFFVYRFIFSIYYFQNFSNFDFFYSNRPVFWPIRKTGLKTDRFSMVFESMILWWDCYSMVSC